MRQAPAFQLELRPGRAWCRAVGGLVALATVSGGYWLLNQAMWQLRGAWLEGLMLTCCITLLGLLALALGVAAAHRLRQGLPRSLRWDGQAWWLDEAERRGNERHTGALQVMLDLDQHLLLRFDPLHVPGTSRGVSRSHLALSRADLPLSWHVLRSTLYSASHHAAPQASPEQASRASN